MLVLGFPLPKRNANGSTRHHASIATLLEARGNDRALVKRKTSAQEGEMIPQQQHWEWPSLSPGRRMPVWKLQKGLP